MKPLSGGCANEVKGPRGEGQVSGRLCSGGRPVRVIDEGGELVLPAARGFILLAALIHLQRSFEEYEEAAEASVSRAKRVAKCVAQCHKNACMLPSTLSRQPTWQRMLSVLLTSTSATNTDSLAKHKKTKNNEE